MVPRAIAGIRSVPKKINGRNESKSYQYCNIRGGSRRDGVLPFDIGRKVMRPFLNAKKKTWFPSFGHSVSNNSTLRTRSLRDNPEREMRKKRKGGKRISTNPTACEEDFWEPPLFSHNFSRNSIQKTRGGGGSFCKI